MSTCYYVGCTLCRVYMAFGAGSEALWAWYTGAESAPTTLIVEHRRCKKRGGEVVVFGECDDRATSSAWSEIHGEIEEFGFGGIWDVPYYLGCATCQTYMKLGTRSKTGRLTWEFPDAEFAVNEVLFEHGKCTGEAVIFDGDDGRAMDPTWREVVRVDHAQAAT